MPNSKLLLLLGVLVIGFFAFAASLIITNHAGDLRSFLLLMGTGIGQAFNAYLVWRNSQLTQQTKQSADHAAEQATTAATTAGDVKDAINGSA